MAHTSIVARVLHPLLQPWTFRRKVLRYTLSTVQGTSSSLSKAYRILKYTPTCHQDRSPEYFGHMLRNISGVLVHSTTCKRLTNSLPKLSPITLSLLKRRDSRSAEYTVGRVNIQWVLFPGYTGESILQGRHGESLKKFIIVDGGIRTHDPKNPWSVDDAIC